MTLTLTRKEEADIRRRRAARANKRAIGKRVQHVNAKPDRGRERDPLFLAYLRRQPCEASHLGDCDGRIEAAHIRYSDGPGRCNPGMGRKNHDRHANPLCHHHHQHDQHKRRERAFWASLGKDAYERAAVHFAAFSGNSDVGTRRATAPEGPPDVSEKGPGMNPS